MRGIVDGWPERVWVKIEKGAPCVDMSLFAPVYLNLYYVRGLPLFNPDSVAYTAVDIIGPSIEEVKMNNRPL